MRFIRRNNVPEALTRWLALRNKANQPLAYSEAGNVEVNGKMVSVVAEIRRARIADQGGICAYTMMRIDEESCHNEHLIPQAESLRNGRIKQTLAYSNIVACYPKQEKPGGCGFGAPVRGTKSLAVKPLDRACEERIHFDRGTGKAEPVDSSDEAVKELIEDVLILNHPALIQRRLTAFEKAGVGLKGRHQLSEKKARDFAVSVREHRRGENLAPFCVAVAQAAIAHADLIGRRRRQRSAGT